MTCKIEASSMVKITKTLTLPEIQMLRRIGGTLPNALLFARILQDCTDLTAAEIFSLKEEEVLPIFHELVEKSLDALE